MLRSSRTAKRGLVDIGVIGSLLLLLAKNMEIFIGLFFLLGGGRNRVSTLNSGEAETEAGSRLYDLFIRDGSKRKARRIFIIFVLRVPSAFLFRYSFRFIYGEARIPSLGLYRPRPIRSALFNPYPPRLSGRPSKRIEISLSDVSSCIRAVRSTVSISFPTTTTSFAAYCRNYFFYRASLRLARSNVRESDLSVAVPVLRDSHLIR